MSVGTHCLQLLQAPWRLGAQGARVGEEARSTTEVVVSPKPALESRLPSQSAGPSSLSCGWSEQVL